MYGSCINSTATPSCSIAWLTSETASSSTAGAQLSVVLGLSFHAILEWPEPVSALLNHEVTPTRGSCRTSRVKGGDVGDAVYERPGTQPICDVGIDAETPQGRALGVADEQGGGAQNPALYTSHRIAEHIGAPPPAGPPRQDVRCGTSDRP